MSEGPLARVAVAPDSFLGYREDGSPGSTGVGSREAEGRRGRGGSLETGSPLFGFGGCYKLGQCLAQPIVSRVREWRSSRYGVTEKVSAGMLGAAPASGSPSRGLAVGLI